MAYDLRRYEQFDLDHRRLPYRVPKRVDSSLKTEEAAMMLGVAPGTLRDWKCQRIGPLHPIVPMLRALHCGRPREVHC
jgi:hypothetical protein